MSKRHRGSSTAGSYIIRSSPPPPEINMEQKFNESAERVKSFTKRPSDSELLELYALFKQATVGDNDTEKPGMFDLKGKAKWQAWADRKGTSKDAAMEAYIKLVEELTAKYA
uniref:ACB domain-containing protein n=2 Tax=Anopheles stephensi TaxID=30069 RepID=A0A182XYV2_ANOST